MQRRANEYRESDNSKSDERKREWSGSYWSVCVLEIRYVYFMMLVASPWMLFFDYTRNSVAKNMRHIYLHVKFNVRFDIAYVHTQIQSCWYSSHIHTRRERENENRRELRTLTHRVYICTLYGVVCAMAAPSRNESNANVSKFINTQPNKPV